MKGSVTMNNLDIMSIYDRLCFALTACEADITDPEYDKGAALYNDILAVVEDMAEKLN